MGFLDGLMGNATEMDMSDLEEELREIVIEGEEIEKGYKVLRDYFVFTNKRLLLIDKQGMTGNKVEYHSIPYKSIRHFSVETAGTFDADSELKLWIAGSNMPLQKQFGKKGDNILEVQKTLAKYLL
ncbi:MULTISPECIES: PH domain-containing protein [unclassified Candidatus Frackibacter]|uniref:PH domain-containing protein n=1 Tax=unclassified Candidatus Frackibacter TaxID=2648818 RepID=UPI0008919306|nr:MULTISPECIES: PH domain-containing protein [unclassified Candidatus Frackibacter]SDC27533.1 PH domain-containing protein [Candidatus Frackibacter sp. WG11]SEM54463.1 PH domain-containing protein [Candidatus Frackibacter sp. WG12]SFL53906.1 PH domain-containing protein [Candidatus Frackibacter sp. WG13]